MKNFRDSSFARFFTKFPKLVTANLLFSVPLAVITVIAVLIGWATGFNNIIIWCLGIIPVFPLYSGLVMVVRKYAVEKKDVPVLDTFKKTVKENWKAFLIHGIVVYLLIVCTVFALLYYYSLAKTDMTFGGVLTLYILFTILLLMMMHYVPVMSVTYDLKIKDVYKNSFLLIFGKIVRNIIALVSVAIPATAILFGVMFTDGIWFYVTGILAILILPLLYSYISISIIAKGLQDTVGS
ncbi:MAG: DUF624 domain-containing protein, partial [Ruminococcus sp.]